jgi:hypothetical protein
MRRGISWLPFLFRLAASNVGRITTLTLANGMNPKPSTSVGVFPSFQSHVRSKPLTRLSGTHPCLLPRSPNPQLMGFLPLSPLLGSQREPDRSLGVRRNKQHQPWTLRLSSSLTPPTCSCHDRRGMGRLSAPARLGVGTAINKAAEKESLPGERLAPILPRDI